MDYYSFSFKGQLIGDFIPFFYKKGATSPIPGVGIFGEEFRRAQKLSLEKDNKHSKYVSSTYRDQILDRDQAS